jgi:DNA polymerase epsilon subunit 2
MQQQLSHPHYVQRIGSESDEDEEPTFVILSDVHLDQPRVLQQLEALLATYENYSPSRLPLFVFMGNFSSSTTRTAPPLDELATVLSAFANLSKHAHFVLVPGPNDSAQQVLPLPPLSAKMPRVAHVHWATNPSRIYYKGREVALFCYNVLHTLQRKQICLPVVPQSSAETDLNDSMDDEEKSSHERHLHQRLVRTLLDQGHLLPVQGIPVFWNYDHALRLYPLPDALILGGDAVKDGFHEVYGGCDVVHAGSLANDSGNYAIYRWEDDAMIKAASMEDDDEDAGSGSVVFAKCGAGPTMESL